MQSMRIRSLHVLSQDPVEVTLSLPAGWEGDSQGVTTMMDGRYVGVEAGDITHVYADPCQWTGTASEAVGPTVDDLATALAQQPMHDTTVSDIEVDGFAGKLVSMSVPDDLDVAECDEGEFRSWVYHVQDPGRQDDVYILDVDGTRVVIVVAHYPDLPQADLDELDAIVQSLLIGGVTRQLAMPSRRPNGVEREVHPEAREPSEVMVCCVHGRVVRASERGDLRVRDEVAAARSRRLE